MRSVHLPAPLTELIGRAQDVATGRRTLLDPHIRLLTLTGPPGTGKTRLALALAHATREDFPDGAWFVPLAPLQHADLVLPTLAQVLGVRQIGRRPLSEALAHALRDRRVLVVLDNLEHLLAAAPSMVELLTACPRLTILATSRALLHVTGEHQLQVGPLELPSVDPLPALEDLEQVPAVRLFVQRTRALRPDFEISDGNARSVAEVCLRMDGLPLAIELAAAATTLLEPDEIVARLRQRLALPGDSPRDVPSRHRTLRDAIGWSYELLSSDEQRLFRRLGVFAGGCTLDAAHAVANGSDDPPLDVLGGISSLVDRSLLRRTISERRDLRLEMLETIRDYALEQLERTGELDPTRWRHAKYFAAFGEQVANPRLDESDGPLLLDRLEREHDNLRSALRWLQERHETASLVQLAGALWAFWEMRGHWSEGLVWLEAALVHRQTASPRARARALLGAAVLLRCRTDFSAAVPLAQESIDIMRGLEDPELAPALLVLGQMRALLGDFAAGAALCAESVRVRRRQHSPIGMAWSLTIAAQVAMYSGDFATARHHCEAALRLRQGHGGGGEIDAQLLLTLAQCAVGQGNPEAAIPLLEQCLALFRSRGQRRGIAWTLAALGDVSQRHADAAVGRTLLEDSLSLFRELGESLGIVITSILLDEPIPAGILAEVGEHALSSAWRGVLGREPPREVLEHPSGMLADPAARASKCTPTRDRERLSSRELEVLALLGRRLSNREIADTLFLSVRTVERHVANIYAKTGMSSRRQAAAGAAEMGLLTPD